MSFVGISVVELALILWCCWHAETPLWVISSLSCRRCNCAFNLAIMVFNLTSLLQENMVLISDIYHGAVDPEQVLSELPCPLYAMSPSMGMICEGHDGWKMPWPWALADTLFVHFLCVFWSWALRGENTRGSLSWEPKPACVDLSLTFALARVVPILQF